MQYVNGELLILGNRSNSFALPYELVPATAETYYFCNNIALWLFIEGWRIKFGMAVRHDKIICKTNDY